MKKCSSSCEADWTVFQGTIWFFKSDLEKNKNLVTGLSMLQLSGGIPLSYRTDLRGGEM